MTHPPAPWRLYGECVIVPAFTSARQLGGVFLADYRAGTLRYHELIVFERATSHGMAISHIYVDDEQSLSGGHSIWRLPKELADFELSPRTFTVKQDGAALLHARIRRRPGFLPLRLPTPFTSPAGNTIGDARVKAAPALVELDIPAASPFAHLGLAGTHVALAGDDLDLTMPPPRS